MLGRRKRQVPEVRKLRIGPTDTLLFKYRTPLDPALVKDIKAQVEEHLPDGVKVMVVDDSCDVEVITQGSPVKPYDTDLQP